MEVQDNSPEAAEAEHTIQEQQEEVLLVDLVEQEFQEQAQQQPLQLVMEPKTEVVAVEEMVKLHLLQIQEMVDQVLLF
tara:strand:- start:213 stop:446 length:234 start_codon:yes stop_codon:yes gene_type:complete